MKYYLILTLKSVLNEVKNRSSIIRIINTIKLKLVFIKNDVYGNICISSTLVLRSIAANADLTQTKNQGRRHQIQHLSEFTDMHRRCNIYIFTIY